LQFLELGCYNIVFISVQDLYLYYALNVLNILQVIEHHELGRENSVFV